MMTNTSTAAATYQPRVMLVTGGAGFIGANFIRYLLASDPSITIINLDLLTYAGSLTKLANLTAPQRHIFVQGDIKDAQLISKLLVDYHIDTIVHFAAESHVDRSISGPAQFIETNIVGTFNLLAVAKQIWLDQQQRQLNECRFHHISTDEVYGSLLAHEAAFTETTPYQPNSPYSASKAGSDHLVRAYAHTYSLPVTISNCSNNYGPYQHQEKFIPTIINACLKQQPIPVYGDGRNIRDWLYVEDHCRAIDVIIRRGTIGETYNIGGWNEQANIEMVNYICTQMDKRFPAHQPHANLITFVTDRLGHDWRYAVDASKIKQQLAWYPQENFATGIEKTLEFYLNSEEKAHI